MNRRLLLLMTAGGAVCLIPWMLFLAGTLPDGYATDNWRLAWVGFDVLLLAGLGSSAWLGIKRRRGAVPVLIATATLLFCDAWFDVVLGWSGEDRWINVLMALGAEIPLGLFLSQRAHHMLAANQPPRVVTAVEARDILSNPARQQIMRALRQVPATTESLAARLRVDPAELADELSMLEVAGFVRRDDDDQWRDCPLDLRIPDRISAQDWAAFKEWQDHKLAEDIDLLANAARHPARYGPWTKGSRGALLLTREELTRFYDEYMELLTRYWAPRDQTSDAEAAKSGPELRRMAVRLYAFPQSFGAPPTPDQPAEADAFVG